MGLPIYVDKDLGIDTNDADMAPNATIAEANISANNGVIHVIDAVLVPIID